MTTISILASGRGSNFQAIADHKKLGVFENVDIGVLIYNYPEAITKKIADNYGIKSRYVESRRDRIQFYNEIKDILKQYNTDLVCLAGWDRVIGREFFDPYKWGIMNIHPALLPSYGEKGLNGMNVHEAVLKDGTKITGCTIFFTDISVDRGPIILQHAVEVGEKEKGLFWEDWNKGLTAESNRGVQLIADRVLIFEHRLYSKAIQLFADGKLKVETYSSKLGDNGEDDYEDREIVRINCDEKWYEKWNKRETSYIEHQKEQWAKKGPLEVLLSPQPS